MRPPLVALRPQLGHGRRFQPRAAAPDIISAFESAVGIKDILGDLSGTLRENLDPGLALEYDVSGMSGATAMVLDSIGRDLIVFLAASVVVTPVARYFNITPILGYLLVGAFLGPNGMNVVANSEAVRRRPYDSTEQRAAFCVAHLATAVLAGTGRRAR